MSFIPDNKNPTERTVIAVFLENRLLGNVRVGMAKEPETAGQPPTHHVREDLAWKARSGLLLTRDLIRAFQGLSFSLRSLKEKRDLGLDRVLDKSNDFSYILPAGHDR